MAIKKEGKIGKHTCMHAEFGTGDIQINAAEGDDYVAVSFRNSEVKPIGTHDTPELVGTPIDELKPQFVMTFNRVESIDAIMRSLQESKDALIRIQEPLIDHITE